MAINPTENSREYIGIVVDNQDPNGLGGHKVFVPQLHGHDVKVEHLPWVRYTVPPGGAGGSTNYGILDTGQVVSFRKDIGEGGTGFGTITGLYQTKQKADPNMPGNVSLIETLRQVSEAIKKELPKVRVPPNIEETTVDGAKVRQAVEKGTKHAHELLKEIMSHGAIFPLNGTHLPELKNIGTGIEPVIKTLTAAIQSNLPGSAINLNQIFDLIPDALMSELESVVPADALTALKNTTALMSGVTTSASDGSSSGNRKVDLNVMIPQLVDLLKTAKQPSDIINIFSELTTNTAIGAIGSEAINIEIDTEHGKMVQVIDPVTGAITLSIPDDVQKALDSFSSLMGSIPGANGAQLFGTGAKAMTDMIQRLKSAALREKAARKHKKNASTAEGTDARKDQNIQATAWNTTFNRAF